MNSKIPELSIIIPAYNEELRLPETLTQICKYVRSSGRETEVIVVDDGSVDRTVSIAESFCNQIPLFRVLSNGQNRGKGFSVRHGMVQARGRIVLFTDADLSAPIEEADKLLAALEDHDLAIGSRALNRNLIVVRQSRLREFAGVVFNLVVRFFLDLSFVDTQCGFKAFRREACRIVFDHQTLEGFGFDPELLYLAHRHGLHSVEIPVRWAHSPNTKVNMFRDSLRMFLDVLVIRYNLLAGRYPRAQFRSGAKEQTAIRFYEG
jgi:glycosyltransferase involved in cell wall biosynthesis